MGNVKPHKHPQYIRLKLIRMLNSGRGSHFDIPSGKAGSTRPPESVGPSRQKTEPRAAPEADTTAPGRNRRRRCLLLLWLNSSLLCPVFSPLSLLRHLQPGPACFAALPPLDVKEFNLPAKRSSPVHAQPSTQNLHLQKPLMLILQVAVVWQ